MCVCVFESVFGLSDCSKVVVSQTLFAVRSLAHARGEIKLFKLAHYFELRARLRLICILLLYGCGVNFSRRRRQFDVRTFSQNSNKLYNIVAARYSLLIMHKSLIGWAARRRDVDVKEKHAISATSAYKSIHNEYLHEYEAHRFS